LLTLLKTLTGLSDLRKKNLVTKRKYKTSHSNSKKVTKLWFVVHGDESMLEQLTTKWNSIEVQTAWKLEPVLCYKKNDIPASDDQSTAVTTPLTIPAPPADEKSSCDVALEDLESETQEMTMNQAIQEGSVTVNAQGSNSSDAQATASQISSTSTPTPPFLGVN